jgi:CRP-like cAMP-binding protein
MSASTADLVLASPLGRELSREEAAVLGALVAVRDLAPGELLVRAGTRDDHLHVIVSGALEVTRQADGSSSVLYALQPGELAGELSFMDEEVRYASLVASRPTRVLVLQRAQLETLLETHPRIVYKVMRAIMRVAHDVQRRLSVQMSDLQNYFFRPGAKF